LNTLYDASILEMEFNDATLPIGRPCVVFRLSRNPSIKSKERDMHPTIRRKPLFALFVSRTWITLGVLLNACQPSEAHSPEAPDQAAVRIQRTCYTADYHTRDHWLAVPPIGMWGDGITPFP
jgi:hypothetical protein